MITVNDLLRDPIKEAGVYVAGMALSTEELNSGIVKLNANENPFGPSTKALEAMAEELKRGNLYPGNVMDDFKKKLAEHFHLDVEQFSIFNGSGAAINGIGETFLNPGDEMIISSPTYMAYAPMPSRMGAKIVETTSRDGLYTDLDAISAAITEKTKLIFICNPNNPTGTILDHAKLDAFVENLPDHVVCAIDEAYFDWIDLPDYQSAFRFIHTGKKVMVLRTFSKIYGMAGIRAGFVAASKELTQALARAANLYYSNRIAMAGAMAALDDTEFYNKAFENNKIQREYLTEEMTKMGIDVVESQTSFLYFDAHCNTEKCMQMLTDNKIYIRPFGEQYLRVSIGLPHENQAFLDCLQEALLVCKKAA